MPLGESFSRSRFSTSTGSFVCSSTCHAVMTSYFFLLSSWDMLSYISSPFFFPCDEKLVPGSIPANPASGYSFLASRRNVPSLHPKSSMLFGFECTFFLIHLVCSRALFLLESSSMKFPPALRYPLYSPRYIPLE